MMKNITQLENKKYKVFKHILISWMIFSVLYWIAAYFKPFHVDEFYSWVYAERCTFKEILQLKDFGIGHPPLYHLIQKLVQSTLPSYHPLYVRLANYLIGSLFISIFVYVFLNYRNLPYFCYGVCSSATILDIFVFSRMYSLVCLSSLLLLWAGEKYYKTSDRKYLVFLLGICLLGFISHYCFVLLIPYIVIVLFFRKPGFRSLLYLSLILLIIAWFSTTYLQQHVKRGRSIIIVLCRLFADLPELALKIGSTLFNFWFVEIYLIALLTFGALIIMEILKRNNFSRTWRINNFTFWAAIFSFIRKRSMSVLDMSIDKNRAIMAFTGGSLIILAVNPLFSRVLINNRYLLILFPNLLYFIFITLHQKTLYTISIILCISGLIYVSSNRISDYYPPQSFDEDIPIIFQNEYAYSTHYLRNTERFSETPFIIDFSYFERYCRICRMGTNDIPFHNYDTVWLVGWSNSNYSKFIPSNFALYSKRDINLTWLDRLQFKYLTPILARYLPPSPRKKFAVFVYRRLKK